VAAAGGDPRGDRRELAATARPAALAARPGRPAAGRPGAGRRGPPTRITCVGADGRRYAGVAALARALDHLDLAWAWLGWALRLPLIVHATQLLADALDAEPRTIRAR